MPKSSSKGGGRKERVTPPKTKLLSREGSKLRRGDPAAARILAESSLPFVRASEEANRSVSDLVVGQSAAG